jgi:hypothetical protein
MAPSGSSIPLPSSELIPRPLCGKIKLAQDAHECQVSLGSISKRLGGIDIVLPICRMLLSQNDGTDSGARWDYQATSLPSGFEHLDI